MNRRRGFTLVEVLVALGVLSFVMILLFSITRGVSDIYTHGASAVDNYATGRAVLDTLSTDLRNAVLSQQAVPFPTNSDATALSFFTGQPGMGAGIASGQLRNVSYVRYSLDNSGARSDLIRCDASLSWASSNLASIAAGADFHTNRLSSGVLCFDHRFILTDGTAAATVTNLSTLAAVRVSMAIADPKTLKLLSSLNQLGPVSRMLQQATAASGTLSAKSVWESRAQSLALDPVYAERLHGGIQFFERTVPVSGGL